MVLNLATRSGRKMEELPATVAVRVWLETFESGCVAARVSYLSNDRVENHNEFVIIDNVSVRETREIDV
jgi:hypothetical protein